MDENNRIFLQANITVVEISKTNDSVSNAMKAIRDRKANTSVISNANNSSDESEQEIEGLDLLKTYEHFHKNQIVNQNRIRKNRFISYDEEDKINSNDDLI